MAYCENCGCDGRANEAEVDRLRIELKRTEESHCACCQENKATLAAQEEALRNIRDLVRLIIKEALSTPTPGDKWEESGEREFWQREGSW